MKVALCTAVWQRHDLTQVLWNWTDHLAEWWAPSVELVKVCAGSQDREHERMAAAAGAEYIDVPNSPLGRKWNMTLKLARGLGADAVLIQGSDDFFCQRTAEALGDALRSDQPYTGLGDFYFYDVPTERLGYFGGYDNPRKAHRIGEPSGSGRILPMSYLRKLGFALWKPRPQMSKEKGYQNHGVDHGSFKRVRLAAAPDYPPLGHPPLIWLREICGTAIGIKGSGTNLWPFEATNPRPVPAYETDARVLGRLPADIWAQIQDLAGVPA